MTAREFFDLVVTMRQAQKNYFKTRNQGYLDNSRHLEKLVDAEILRVQKIINEPELNFNEQ